VVKSGKQAIPTLYYCCIYIFLFFGCFWIFSNFITLSADAMSSIAITQVLIAALPSAAILYFVFEAINKLFVKA